LDQINATPVTVNYATQDNTAVAGTDYVAANGTVVFNPGETSKTVKVFVLPDSHLASGTFFVNLTSAVNATIADGQGIGTITNSNPVATHVQFIQQPTNATAGQPLTPAITVAVEDASNNVV